MLNKDLNINSELVFLEITCNTIDTLFNTFYIYVSCITTYNESYISMLPKIIKIM
ncbi:hypothetical protein PIROE2DRAFT_8816 [Piromyces sp. E2]|nr:hypothetical protein PIROE2DRAFT_8816 [Piromyces sp. E2]|eukprot:OUM64427.1 hypothetical protein PIROE2DRAFT_8816 [Piromyces sp. E2]